MPPTDEDASNTGECDGQSSEPAAVDANAKRKAKASAAGKSKAKGKAKAQPKPKPKGKAQAKAKAKPKASGMKRPAAKPVEKATPSKKEKGAKEKGTQPQKREVKEEWKDGLPKPEHDGSAAEEEGGEEAGEEEFVKEEDPTMDPNLNLEAGGCEENDATKNRIKARKFNAMLKAGQLPSWLATAWEKTLEMGPGKQDRQRMLVNAAFDHKNGRLILNVDKPIFRDVQKTYQKTEASDKSKSLTKLLFKKKWNLTEEEFAQGLADKEFYEVTDAAGKLKYGWDVSEHSTTRGKEGSSAVEAIHEGNRQDAKFIMQLAGDWKIGLFSKSSSSKSGMLALHDSDKEINPEQWKQAQKQLNLGMAACERLHQSAKKLLQVIGVDAKEDELWSKLLLGQDLQFSLQAFTWELA